jgi:hypothetical protein
MKIRSPMVMWPWATAWWVKYIVVYYVIGMYVYHPNLMPPPTNTNTNTRNITDSHNRVNVTLIGEYSTYVKIHSPNFTIRVNSLWCGSSFYSHKGKMYHP